MKKWFALHTRPHAEKRVASQLARRDVETFVPGTRSASKGQAGKFRPLFPGYLFVRVNLKEEASAAWLRYPGVRYLVAYDDEPVPIQEEVIALLRQKLAERTETGRNGKPRFKPGGLVRIKDGPFGDMLAIFEGPSRPTQRVQVLLKALDRSVRLRLSISELDEVDAETTRERVKRPRRTRGRGRRINYT